MSSITKLKITLDRIHCHLASADVSTEPGVEDEWTMMFTVDGQSQPWHNENVRTGQDYPLGFVFTVPIDPNYPHKTVQLSASGYEVDSSSANDNMPSAEDTKDPVNDWGSGGTFSFSGGDSEYHYEIFYKVEVAETTAGPAGSQPLKKGREFICVFREGDSGSTSNANWNDFVAKWKDLNKNGYRLNTIDTYREDTGKIGYGDTMRTMYLGTYERGNGGYYLYSGLTQSDALTKATELHHEGFRVEDVDGYLEGGKPRFTMVLRPGTDKARMILGVTWNEFWNKFQELSQAGYRLKSATTWNNGSTRHWGGIWREGSGGHYFLNGMTWEQLQKNWNKQYEAGYRLVDILSYPNSNRKAYAAYFRPGSYRQEIVRVSGVNELNNIVNTYAAKGFVATRVIAVEVGGD